jgi:O-antigen/teichoic acid export membrane protein
MVALLGGTMLTVDMLMLGWFGTASAVGQYSAVQKIIQIAYSLAGIAGISLFSTFSRLYGTDYSRFKELFAQAFRTMTILSALIAVLGIMLAKPIIWLVYGSAYLGGILSFQLLAATFFLLAPTEIGIHALLAAGKQKIFLYSAPIGAITNAGLDALLIPYWGIAGAAFSTLVTQIAINTYLYREIRKL